MKKFAVSIAEAIEQLQKEKDKRFTVVMEDGSMSVEYFAPLKIDTQRPHEQDELYVIVSGESEFYRDGETIKCSKGDVLFVPARMEHRFINFSDDFATWVIFYGERKVR
jgi:mannose-6-phosphate isomerase-like protein (cupin superfamily)